MTFVPQENDDQLAVLTSMLTPFLKTVKKALSFELENRGNYGEKKAIIDGIIQNLPAENSISSFYANLSQVSEILQDEFHLLNKINIK